MFRGFSQNVDRSQPPRRSSNSTVASSEAAYFGYQNNTDQPENFDSTPNASSVKIEGSSAIHVGDIYYYAPPPNVKTPSFNNFASTSKRSSTRSLASTQSLSSPSNTKSTSQKFCLKKKIVILLVAGVTLSGLITITWLTINLIKRNQNNTGNSTLPPTTITTTDDPAPFHSTEASTTTTEIPTTLPTTTSVSTDSSTSSTDLTTTPTTTPENVQCTPPAEDTFSIVTREEWGASVPKPNITCLSRPIGRIIVAHSMTPPCDNEEDCKSLIANIQSSDMNYDELDDISVNFLIGGDGSVFKGRGFEFEGQHTETAHGSSFNNIGIGVSMIGDFSAKAPSEAQLDALQSFICYFQSTGVMKNDSLRLFLQDDLVKTSVPADALRLSLENKFPDFFKKNISKIYSRNEWMSQSRRKDVPRREGTAELVVVFDTVDDHFCTSTELCKASLRSLHESQMSFWSFADIGSGFYIGDVSDEVFEGRGFDLQWELLGTIYQRYITTSLSVSFMGYFGQNPETDLRMIDTLKHFLEFAVSLGKITQNYKIGTIRRETHALYQALKDLDNFTILNP